MSIFLRNNTCNVITSLVHACPSLSDNLLNYVIAMIDKLSMEISDLHQDTFSVFYPWCFIMVVTYCMYIIHASLILC